MDLLIRRRREPSLLYRLATIPTPMGWVAVYLVVCAAVGVVGGLLQR